MTGAVATDNLSVLVLDLDDDDDSEDENDEGGYYSCQDPKERGKL